MKNVCVAGLIEPESITETVFDAPRRTMRDTDIRNHSEDKTHLLSDTDNHTDYTAAGDGYVNVNLDEDRDSEFELVR